MSESDGISEAVDAEVRAAVMAAAQLAEQLARHAEGRARDAERDAAAAAAQAEQRLIAERDTARAEVAQAREQGWWDTADPDAAARVYATADVWRDPDPQLRRDAEQIETQLQERFGPDVRQAVVDGPHHGRALVDQPSTGGADVRVQGAAAEARFAAIVAENARLAAGRATAERTSAATAVETAQERLSAAPGWDNPARREAFATSLEHVADTESVDARLRLDKARAHPGRAVAGVTPAVRARPARGPVAASHNQISR